MSSLSDREIGNPRPGDTPSALKGKQGKLCRALNSLRRIVCRITLTLSKLLQDVLVPECGGDICVSLDRWIENVGRYFTGTTPGCSGYHQRHQLQAKGLSFSFHCQIRWHCLLLGACGTAREDERSVTRRDLGAVHTDSIQGGVGRTVVAENLQLDGSHLLQLFRGLQRKGLQVAGRVVLEVKGELAQRDHPLGGNSSSGGGARDAEDAKAPRGAEGGEDAALGGVLDSDGVGADGAGEADGDAAALAGKGPAVAGEDVGGQGGARAARALRGEGGVGDEGVEVLAEEAGVEG